MHHVKALLLSIAVLATACEVEPATSSSHHPQTVSEFPANHCELWVDKLTVFPGASSSAFAIYVKVDLEKLDAPVSHVNLVRHTGHLMSEEVPGQRFFSDDYWRIAIPAQHGPLGSRGDIYVESESGKRLFLTTDGTRDMLLRIRDEASSGDPFSAGPFLVFDRGLARTVEAQQTVVNSGSLDSPDNGVSTFGTGFAAYNPRQCPRR